MTPHDHLKKINYFMVVTPSSFFLYYLVNLFFLSFFVKYLSVSMVLKMPHFSLFFFLPCLFLNFTYPRLLSTDITSLFCNIFFSSSLLLSFLIYKYPLYYEQYIRIRLVFFICSLVLYVFRITKRRDMVVVSPKTQFGLKRFNPKFFQFQVKINTNFF